MPFANSIFYLFAVLAVLSALGVVLTKNVLYAAFSLIVTFFCVAGVYVFAGAEFVAVVQIMVYAGGILVLMAFGIMLTNKISGQAILTANHNRLIGALLGGVTFLGLFYGILKVSFGTIGWMQNERLGTGSDGIKKVGILLMSDYILPFEIIGILLLIALVGAAVVAQGGKEVGNDSN